MNDLVLFPYQMQKNYLVVCTGVSFHISQKMI